MGMMRHIFTPQAPPRPQPLPAALPWAWQKQRLGMGALHFSMMIAVKGELLVMGQQPPVLLLTATLSKQLRQGPEGGVGTTQGMPSWLFLLFERLRVSSEGKGANLWHVAWGWARNCSRLLLPSALLEAAPAPLPVGKEGLWVPPGIAAGR